ncbi:hypothetical protein MLD38_034321 [Melastoma candidum]|uniref:Uncharacterized protein n=1 Tax=Melastoma candidum TaxID=119954 RepID=A0ACB9MDS3_9MYRT|nr:hypothetical protein MLD38_034321 [Melastoma candidum]
MRTMVDFGRTSTAAAGPHSSTSISFMRTPTAIDCSSHTVMCRRSSFRCLVQLMAPCFFPFQKNNRDHVCRGRVPSVSPPSRADSVTITFFGHRKGKRVNLCIQHHARTLLFLQLSVPTSHLAREMQSGVLRVTLACNVEDPDCLYEVPVWRMYWNGRKVGYGVRRVLKEAKGEEGVLRVVRKVSVGAGLVRLGGDGDDNGNEVIYMRARFNRVVGSADSEAFHMINPEGCVRQELSLFLLRSRD